MSDPKENATIHLHYDIPGDDFTRAGEASSTVKKMLKQIGLPPEVVRRAAIAMYEGEINVVIHAGGGEMDVDIDKDLIRIVLRDEGPGIPDIALAMRAGYSTAKSDVCELGFGAGMGLPNMQKNADDLLVESKIGQGTTVTIKIDVDGGSDQKIP